MIKVSNWLELFPFKPPLNGGDFDHGTRMRPVRQSGPARRRLMLTRTQRPPQANRVPLTWVPTSNTCKMIEYRFSATNSKTPEHHGKIGGSFPQIGTLKRRTTTPKLWKETAIAQVLSMNSLLWASNKKKEDESRFAKASAFQSSFAQAHALALGKDHSEKPSKIRQTSCTAAWSTRFTKA